MEKIKLDLHPVKNKSVKIEDINVSVVPYVSTKDKYALISEYVDHIIDGTDFATDYVVANGVLILGVIESNTNIDIDSGISLDDIICSGVWDRVKNAILNYQELKDEADTAIRYSIEMKKIEIDYNGALLQVLNKASALLDEIAKVDLSKEGVEKIISALNYEKNEINKIIDPSKVKEE